MLFKTSKIRLDKRSYFSGSPRSKLPLEPFERLAVVLGIVATAYAMTERDDVGHNRSRTIRSGQRNPVILCQRMPQPRRATANSAAAVEVGQRPLPFIQSRCVRQLPSAGTALDVRDLSSRQPAPAMLAAITSIIFTNMIGVVVSPLTTPFWVLGTKTARVLKVALAVTGLFAPASGAFPFPFTVSLAISQPTTLRRIGFGNATALLHSALSAFRMQAASLLAVAVEVFRRGWKVLLTFCATLEGCVRIVHGIASTTGYAQPPAVSSSAGTSLLYHESERTR